MTTITKQNWLIPAGLLALSALPVVAGSVRLAQLASGSEINSDNARFFAAPIPVVIHIVSVAIYCLFGALQFAPDFRRRKPSWHRIAGRILIPCGIISALTGLWMTQFYPSANYDGIVVYFVRLIVGFAMTLFLCLGYIAIRQRNIKSHKSWMMRSYALGIGAGTQVLTHLPWFIFPSIQGELARSICMTAGWVINFAVVEWILINAGRSRSKI